MYWELKQQLVTLGNCAYRDFESNKSFQDFVIKNISNFDNQSWDMFITVSVLSVDIMKQNLDYWRKIYEQLKIINQSDFGFRTLMRIALIETICQDEFQFS